MYMSEFLVNNIVSVTVKINDDDFRIFNFIYKTQRILRKKGGARARQATIKPMQDKVLRKCMVILR